MLASQDGKIVCENTLDARLNVSFRQKLPEVRRLWFVSLLFSSCIANLQFASKQPVRIRQRDS